MEGISEYQSAVTAFRAEHSQGGQAQAHGLCQELQLRNNTTAKSLNHRKKKKKTQQTKPEAFAGLTARAVSAAAGTGSS